MEKSSIVHTRVNPEVKEECEKIFTSLGITTSYAISIFLNQVRLVGGFPFDIVLPKKENNVEFAINISRVDAGKPSDKAIEIMKLYDEGKIDLETAEFAINRLHR